MRLPNRRWLAVDWDISRVLSRTTLPLPRRFETRYRGHLRQARRQVRMRPEWRVCRQFRHGNRSSGRKRNILRAFLFGLNVNALDQVREIISDRRAGGFELLQLLNDGTHEDETGLIRALKRGFQFVRREIIQAQFHCLNQAFVRKRQEIVMIFDGQPGASAATLRSALLV